MASLCIKSGGPQLRASFSVQTPLTLHASLYAMMNTDAIFAAAAAAATTTSKSATGGAINMDLRTALNTCKSSSPSYTRLSDLLEECGYLITNMERVTTPFGETIVVILEGQVGDDYFLRVYLPRRFNTVLSDHDIERYNSGYGDRLRLVKHSPQRGSKFTPLEFV